MEPVLIKNSKPLKLLKKNINTCNLFWWNRYETVFWVCADKLQKCLGDHTEGRVLSQMGSFVQSKCLKLFFLHLYLCRTLSYWHNELYDNVLLSDKWTSARIYAELFHKDFLANQNKLVIHRDWPRVPTHEFLQSCQLDVLGGGYSYLEFVSHQIGKREMLG